MLFTLKKSARLVGVRSTISASVWCEESVTFVCWIYSVLGGCFCILLHFLEFTLVNYVYKICSFWQNFKPQRYGNFAKYELYLINLISCHNKRPLKVGIIDILNFSFDICCYGDCKIGFV